MKKILLIPVGGTICTKRSEHGTLAVHGQAGAVLTARFEASASPYASAVEFVENDNLFILSENMTVDNWNRMLSAYRAAVRRDRFDGVIFAHGTDTLGFSAALFSMILADTEIPVFFVSSNAPLASPRANGDRNFAAAVACICEGIAPNVYVTYENISDHRMLLHLASRLQQCPHYSEDFHSVGAVDITAWTLENSRELPDDIARRYPSEARRPYVDSMGAWQLRERVLMLQPYVGLRYDVIDYARFAAVLHGTYHSGTACAEDGADYDACSVRYLLDTCAKCGTDVYLSPSIPTGEVYDTVRVIAEHTANGCAARFLHGTTIEAAYAKLLLLCSVTDDREAIAAAMQTEWNFERLPDRKGE